MYQRNATRRAVLRGSQGVEDFLPMFKFIRRSSTTLIASRLKVKKNNADRSRRVKISPNNSGGIISCRIKIFNTV